MNIGQSCRPLYDRIRQTSPLRRRSSERVEQEPTAASDDFIRLRNRPCAVSVSFEDVDAMVRLRSVGESAAARLVDEMVGGAEHKVRWRFDSLESFSDARLDCLAPVAVPGELTPFLDESRRGGHERLYVRTRRPGNDRNEVWKFRGHRDHSGSSHALSEQSHPVIGSHVVLGDGAGCSDPVIEARVSRVAIGIAAAVLVES